MENKNTDNRKERQIIEATFKIVTPMFIGDAQQKATSLRPPSIKGALRFWWRALNWSRFFNDLSNEATALHDLHREEERLFGSAAEDKGGQGQFLLAVTPSNLSTPKLENPPAPGQQYLLGMGLYHFKNGYLRDPLICGGFGLRLTFKPKASDDDISSIAMALVALGTLGGLGSRSRRGLGSVAIQSLKGTNLVSAPQSAEEFVVFVESLMRNSTDSIPPFSALSRQARVDVSVRGTADPLLLFAKAGNELQLYRSYGQNGKVQGKTAEGNFVADHDLILNVAQGGQVSSVPHRIIFGIPHNYFFSSTKAKVDISLSCEERDRRASPLFMHIHSFPNGESALIQTILPAVFSPMADSVVLTFKAKEQKIKASVDWQYLYAYLNRFAERKEIRAI